jgi:hypothetical protein
LSYKFFFLNAIKVILFKHDALFPTPSLDWDYWDLYQDKTNTIDSELNPTHLNKNAVQNMELSKVLMLLELMVLF